MLRTGDIFLPARFNRMNGWPGQQPGTRTRLHAILDKAALHPGGLSYAERTLFAVCECWSAVATRSLEWHLGAYPEQRLRSLAAVYAAMGAKRAARAMEVTLTELVSAHNVWQRQQCIATLELAMLKARNTVNELIGRFAIRLHTAAQDRAPGPAAVAAATAAATALVTVAATRRRTVTSVRKPLPVTAGRPVARSHVRWRDENPGAAQHE